MQNVIEIKPIETKEVVADAARAEATLTCVQAMEIKDQDTYTRAGDTLKIVKSRAKILEDKRKEITKPLDVAKRAVMDLFRKPLTMLFEAETILKRGMITYTDERERLRREQEDKLRRQAATEEARKKKALEERAKKAEAEGNQEKAEELREKKDEVKVEAPVLASTVEQPKGVAYKDKWTANVLDKTKIPFAYLEPNMSMLNKHAQNTKGKVPIPGVEFKSEKIVASRI